MIFANSASA